MPYIQDAIMHCTTTFGVTSSIPASAIETDGSITKPAAARV